MALPFFDAADSLWEMHWRYFTLALLFLLAASYLDNVRGPLLPLLTHELALPYSQTVWLFVAGSLGGITASLVLKLAERRGLIFAKRFALACGLAATGASFFVDSESTLFLFSFLMGGAISTLGTISNLLIAFGSDPAYRGRGYCALHAMYGLASALGPSAVAGFLALGLKWPITFLPCTALVVALAHTPVQAPAIASSPTSAHSAFRLGFLEWIAILTFVIYVLGEILDSIWMVAYLVETKGHTIETASSYLTIFFLAMAASRILCIMRITEKMERILLWGSQILFVICVTLGQLLHPAFLSLSGLVGPFFPLLMARVTRHFGVKSPSLLLKLYIAIPLSTGVVNLLMGQATRILPLNTLYFTSVVFGAATLPCLFLYLHAEKRDALTHQSA
ncbi:MAG: hypothetical protein HYZ71_15940 [Deltaproteobacteria bacterium]|nr:hypothetical protein [Deltaproteobacteria bacterium]